MYYDDNSRIINFLAGLALGTVLGATTALLIAPQSGKRTRRRLVKAVSGVGDTAGDRWDDLSDDVKSAVTAGRRRLKL
jgi:gas vesicle protein